MFEIFISYKMSQRKRRMSKNEVKMFVTWCFDEKRYNDLINWPSSKIIQEYKNEKGIELSPQFVNLQRRSWIMEDGKIIRL